MSRQAETDIDRVAVIGAGSIGAAWAIVFARAGCTVCLFDTDPAQLKSADLEIAARLGDLAEFDLIGEAPSAIAARISGSTDMAQAVSDAQWVQECAPEDIDLKRELFSRLHDLTEDGVILASSSSTICVSHFVAAAERRRRCLVVHPANPPTLLPIVEVVPAPETLETVRNRAVSFLRAAAMKPIVVRSEIEGFVYNRLQGAVLREAYCLVRDGIVDVDEIDLVVREGLGLRWSIIGPFETVDLNTRGGIAAHAARLGPAYARMGAERGQDDPWTPDLVDVVTASRRNLLPLSKWNDRRSWRDRVLMTMIRAKREALGLFGH